MSGAALDALPAVLRALAAEPPAPAPGDGRWGAPAPELLGLLAALVPSDVVLYNDLAVRHLGEWSGSTSLGDFFGAPLDELPSPGDDDAVAFFSAFPTSPCAHAERTGDFVTAWTLSDLGGLLAWRRSAMYALLRPDLDIHRELLLPLGGPPGHSRRIRFVRLGGRDFDDHERALAQLLRPHLVEHLRRLELGARLAVPLTARQRQLLALVAEGLSNGEIARTLRISPHTVRTHLQQAYTRLGVASRTEAVRLVGPAPAPPRARLRA